VPGSCLSDWHRACLYADQLVQMRGLPRPRRMDMFRQYPASNAIIDRLIDETQDLLDDNWPAVARVAKALYQHVRIEQPALDALIVGKVFARRTSGVASIGTTASRVLELVNEFFAPARAPPSGRGSRSTTNQLPA
jgi:hypothetical protein